MNKFVNILIGICTVFLILNLTIMFLAAYNYSFDIEDKSIIAGIIGFVGAVFGGLLTLVGVRMTISENKKSVNKENLQRKYEIIKNERDFIFQTSVEFDVLDIKNDDEVSGFIEKLYESVKGKSNNSIMLFMDEKLYKEYSYLLGLINQLILALMLYRYNKKSELLDEYQVIKERFSNVTSDFNKKCDTTCNELINEFYKYH